MNLPDSILPLDRRQFESIRETEFRPSYELTGLKQLRDKAKTERDLRELYRNRAPYELLQNADDAHATAAAFLLLADGLAFVHNGQWFTVGNFRSLADGWSDKDPNECIGHKGLGFRAVLDITPAPHLIRAEKSNFFGIKFSYGLNKAHIDDAIRRNSALRSHYDDWGKYGQIRCPVMAIPGLASKASLGSLQVCFDDLYRSKICKDTTTIFWFPDTDSSIEKTALEALDCTPLVADVSGRRRLSDFLTKEAKVLLPFLNNLRELHLYDSGSRIGSVRLAEKGGVGGSRIAVTSEANGQPSTPMDYFRMRFEAPIPPEVTKAPGTPKAVKWMRSARAALLIRVVHDKPVISEDAVVHVYFPTNERTGLDA